jgi:outer membrane protein assembly factor BamB
MKRAIFGLASGLVFALSLVPPPASATTVFVQWSRSKGDVKKSAAALDLTTGAVRWERKFKDVVNFVEAQGEGVLVGCDNGQLVFVSQADGAILWKVELKKEVNVFVGAGEEGFLVSSSHERYWLVSPKGEVVQEWKH